MTEMLEQLKGRLRARVPKDQDSPGCMLCQWILLDLEKNDGKLKGWNMDFFNQPIFPKKGEIAHLKLEEFPFVESEL